MGRRRCCCSTGECFIFEDNFDGPDSTDLGSDWNEVAGQWGTQSNELREEYSAATGTANAQVFCTQPVPIDSPGEMFIEIEVPIASVEDGDEYRIWPCCTNTTTEGPIEVRFTYSTVTSQWTTTITGGTAGASATYSVALTGTPTNVILKVCADHESELVKAWVSPTVNEYAAWDDVDPGEGRYCAVGHNNIGHQNRFDNFSLEELRRGAVVCVSCFCVCDTYAMPPGVTATIVLAEDRAECLGGETWPMDAVLGPQVVQWEGDITIGTETMSFRLMCGDGVPTSFTLINLGPFNCIGISTKSADAALSTCDPLQLYFGPYTLGFAAACSLCYGQNQPPECIMPDPPNTCAGEFWICVTL